jgi:hypothetical protein
LQQAFAAVPLHDLAQPDALASVVPVAAFADVLEQHAFAGVSVLVLTFSVLAFSAEVTFCADAVVTVKAKIRVNNEITSAAFFMGISYFYWFL